MGVKDQGGWLILVLMFKISGEAIGVVALLLTIFFFVLIAPFAIRYLSNLKLSLNAQSSNPS